MKELFEKALMADWKRREKKTELHVAIEYALQSGGKRFRPLIVLNIAETKKAMPAALCVEYFHTASLVADDLPCMDDDDLRRGKPSLHKAFSETTALLASYALICAAFEQIHENVEVLRPEVGDQKAAEIGMIALQQTSKSAGIDGATGGQFLDLFPKKHDQDALVEIMELKTATLFETAFVLGWLFGNKPLEDITNVRAAAKHFGLAFQICDDLCDLRQDQRGLSNIAHEIGFEKAYELLKHHLEAYNDFAKSLKHKSAGFTALYDLLKLQLAVASSG